MDRRVDAIRRRSSCVSAWSFCRRVARMGTPEVLCSTGSAHACKWNSAVEQKGLGEWRGVVLSRTVDARDCRERTNFCAVLSYKKDEVTRNDVIVLSERRGGADLCVERGTA